MAYVDNILQSFTTTASHNTIPDWLNSEQSTGVSYWYAVLGYNDIAKLRFDRLKLKNKYSINR